MYTQLRKKQLFSITLDITVRLTLTVTSSIAAANASEPSSQPYDQLAVAWDAEIAIPVVQGREPVASTHEESNSAENIRYYEIDGVRIRAVTLFTPKTSSEDPLLQLPQAPQESQMVTDENGFDVRSDSTSDRNAVLTTKRLKAKLLPNDMMTPNFAVVNTARELVLDWPRQTAKPTHFRLYADDTLIQDGNDTRCHVSLPENYLDVEWSLELDNIENAGNRITRTFHIQNPNTPDSSDQETRTQSAEPGFQTFSTAFTHTTFIPDARVQMGIAALGCSSLNIVNTEFAGDNRSWFFPDSKFPNGDVPSFRTMIFITVNWQNPHDKILTLKGVRPTVMYQNGNYADTRTASTDGIKFQDPIENEHFAQVLVDHSVGNPFCIAGAITYREFVRFYRDTGIVEVSGSRFPVPNHEMYARVTQFGQERWLMLSRRENQGFFCLTGYCTADSYVLDNR